LRNHSVKKFHRGLAYGALVGGVLLAHAAFAQTPALPLVPLVPFGPAVEPARQLLLNDFTSTNPLIPIDIYRINNSKTVVDHRDLATFAWLSFISAVAPNAGGGQRGVPGGTFASTATPGAGPLVWETYQHRSELFPCNISSTTNKPAPVPPQPWGAPPTYVVGNATAFGVPPTACSTITTPGGFNNLDETSQIGQNFLFFPQTPGSPNPAVDGQVLFEAKANQYESAYVAANYQSLIPAAGSSFYLTPPITLPAGTVEVKAAWRPLSSIPPNQWYRYHIANVLTYSGNANPPVPASEPYALVALHIIHKTPNYPAFIFATFEQVDDFQNQVTNSPTQLYYVPTYTSIDYTIPPTTTFPPTGQTVNNPDIVLTNGETFLPTNPQAVPNGKTVFLPLNAVANLPHATKLPNNMFALPVAAPVPTVDPVHVVNRRALELMHALPGFGPNFVWQYYQLVGVQAVPTNDETTEDFFLANIVVESSQPGIQLFRGFPPIDPNTLLLTNIRNQVNVLDYSTAPPGMTASGGCQGCHGIAQTQQGTDFSFLFAGVAGNGFTPDALGLPANKAELTLHLSKRKYLK
jgi:hypothetical protein